MHKRVEGKNVKVSYDHTGGMVSVDWNCPYCGGYNAGFYFSSNTEALMNDFEIDHACEDCEKMVTIICRDAKPLMD